MSEIGNIREYLEFMAKHSPVAQLLLSKGRDFPIATKQLPKKQRGKLGNCFANAGRKVLVGDADGFEYCEGYALKYKIGLPMAHAWLLDEKGEVVEATNGWDDADEYFGIVIPRQMFVRELMRRKVYGLLVGDMTRKEFVEALAKE